MSSKQVAPFRVLVIPIFRHYWLHYGCTAAADALQSSDKAGADWRAGRGIEEKASLWLTATQHTVRRHTAPPAQVHVQPHRSTPG